MSQEYVEADANVVYYSSPSGNTRRLSAKIGLSALEVSSRYGRESVSIRMKSPFVLLCPTYRTIRGTYVPECVKRFLADNHNHRNLVGVVGTGNKNFGVEFCRSASLIAEKFNVPIVGTVELSGSPDEPDVLRSAIIELIEDSDIRKAIQ